MTSQSVSARLRFLSDSAHLLASSGQRTSAFLMASCNTILFDNDLEQPDSHRRQVCGACGNIMLLGLTATKKMERVKDRGSRNRNIKAQPDQITMLRRVVLYNCELCGEQTRESLDSPPIRHPHDHTSHSRGKSFDTATRKHNSFATTSPTEASNPIAANASSRRRAKVRKQGGLQALLAKKKETDSRGSANGFGLDLMDLMKKN